MLSWSSTLNCWQGVHMWVLPPSDHKLTFIGQKGRRFSVTLNALWTERKTLPTQVQSRAFTMRVTPTVCSCIWIWRTEV